MGNVVYISLASTACGMASVTVLGLVGGVPGGRHRASRERESLLNPPPGSTDPEHWRVLASCKTLAKQVKKPKSFASFASCAQITARAKRNRSISCAPSSVQLRRHERGTTRHEQPIPWKAGQHTDAIQGQQDAVPAKGSGLRTKKAPPGARRGTAAAQGAGGEGAEGNGRRRRRRLGRAVPAPRGDI